MQIPDLAGNGLWNQFVTLINPNFLVPVARRTRLSFVFTRVRKKSMPRTPKPGHRIKRGELIAGLIVGLMVAAVVGYVIYTKNARHP